MLVKRTETLEIRSSDDIIRVRRAVRNFSVDLGFGLVAQTRIVTAASELARNTFIFGKGGTALLEVIEKKGCDGFRITFEDHGPGIPDLELAMKDGYTTGNGLGLGLGGSRRLVDEFEIRSRPGEGTWVRITMWK